jgi:hypothetical protein
MRTPPPVLPERHDDAGERTSWLQRQGADAGLALRSMGWLGLIFLMSLMLGYAVAERIGFSGYPAAGVALLVALVLTGGAGVFILNVANAAGAATLAVVLPSGRSAPYEEQFSYQEALAARGDVAGALESYEAVIAERPDAPLPRLKAAELHARRGGDAARAAELFKSVRDLPSASRRDILFASNRLVDLYDGPLGEPGRAIVELRRIVERFPGSPDASRAQAALPRLKSLLNERREER